MTNLDRFKKDLDSLDDKGERLRQGLLIDNSSEEELEENNKIKNGKEAVKSLSGLFKKEYQGWFTEASGLVRQLIPERYPEFIGYYLADPKRKKINMETYRIQDWMNETISGVDRFSGKKHFNDAAIVKSCFKSQLDILRACRVRFESSLVEIKQLLQADLFDSEIDAARELHKKGFLRASGAMCGVVLERHLSQVAFNHSISIRKKNPTIADLNDPIRNAGVYDVPVWRQVQRLADIRNLCDHNKDREPTKEEVDEFIEGVSKFTKTIY